MVSSRAHKRILALEPFYGGSHRAFLEGWRDHSRHRWTILGLPPHHWKWRMRHAAITLAREAQELAVGGAEWDIIVASDMLNLAEFRGLSNGLWGRLPAVLYFHENQLTYPSRVDDERDFHLAYVNFISAEAADTVWFNSEFHLNEFLTRYDSWLARMPDYSHRTVIREIQRKARVEYPGVNPVGLAQAEANDEPVIVWPARWEHDKNPELLLDVMKALDERNLPFRLRLLGQSFPDTPGAIETLIAELGPERAIADPAPDRESYVSALRTGDIVVSTAIHEFFGLAMVEAISAGCYPVLPNRLAYPEVMRAIVGDATGPYLYDGSHQGLVSRLEKLISPVAADDLRAASKTRADRAAEVFGWRTRGQLLDDVLERVAC